MSATVVAKSLSTGFGAQTLFTDLDLTIAPNDRIGLVGANGAGKSTLLRILAGLIAPDSGAVSISPPAASVGYLPQEPDRIPGETVDGFVRRRTAVAAAQHDLDTATAEMTDGVKGADERYSSALDRWLALGAADLDERIGQVSADIGFTLPLDSMMTSLSGGEAARVGLLSLLLSRFDLLLLDEPTNDLDLAGLERLEQFVTGLRVGAVIVSHDREFLRRTINGVVELDLAQHQVNVFGGGYDDYLREREIKRQQARAAYDEFEQTKAGLTARMQTQRGWAVTGVAKEKHNPRDNDKAARGFRTDRTEKQASKVRATERMIERLDQVQEPRKEWQLQMEIAVAQRSGAVVATLNRAVVRRGAFTLGPVDLHLSWGDRVIITGANGSGKTTLLGLLLGRIAPDDGTASLGSSVIVGEIDQARGLFDRVEPLLDVFAGLVPDQPPEEVRTLLAKFGLGGEHVLRASSSLSPGERTRAALALLQARGVNLLVLDEPTNHLDLPAIEQLESAVESFPGTLLLVSHDRRMLETVRATRRLQVDGGRVAELA